LKRSTKGYIIAGIVGIIAVAVFVPLFMSVFMHESAFQFDDYRAPEEFRTGWCTITVVDAATNDSLPFTLLLYDAENGTYTDFITSSNGTTYIDDVFGVLHVSGHYSANVQVFARNDSSDPYSNLFTAYQVANMTDVTWQLFRINDTYGNFTAGDLPDGFLELHFKVNYNGPGRYGASCWHAPFNNTKETTWIGFNGTATDLTFTGDDLTASSARWDATIEIFPTYYISTFIISGRFENITEIGLFSGFSNDTSPDLVI